MIEEMSQKWLVHITGKLPVTATLNGHDYVDLGIKVDGKLIMWAACDVGATKPEQAGTTYGWGEVEHKANLGGGSVSYGQKVYRSTILGNPKYDAARKHWGGKWRMHVGTGGDERSARLPADEPQKRQHAVSAVAWQ